MPTSRKQPLATGLVYHLLEWGQGDDVVLLLHGFLDNAWSWQPVVEAGLGELGARVVAPDLRGHGDSDWIGAGGYYHFLDYLADVHELVESLAPSRLAVVGHSMGGSVASYYAGTFPARVRKLALLEGLGPPESDGTIPERAATWIAAWKAARARAPRSYASVEEAAAQMSRHDPLLPAALAAELTAKGTAPSLGGRVRFKHDPLHATPGPLGFSLAAASQFWRRVRCPTLIVTGAESQLQHTPEEQARRVACFADARSLTLPGAGHMMQRHQPAALARVLREFLADPS